MVEQDSSTGIQVIARAAAILRACKDEREGLSLGQIAERVKLPRSTVQRIVAALASEELLLAGGDSHSIRIGPQILALAAANRVDVVEVAHPLLKQLAERTGETVDLALFRCDHMVFIDQIAGQQRLRAVSAVGEAFPLHCTANGKAALAMLGEDHARTLLAGPLDRHTSETCTDTEALLAQLREIRETGIAVDREEHSSGISALGAAFRDPAGAIYAVSIPVPTLRFTGREAALAHELRRTVAEVAAALRGHTLGG